MGSSQKPLSQIATAPQYVVPNNGQTVATPAPGSVQTVQAASGEASLTDLSPLTERTGQEILETLSDIRWLLVQAIEGDN